jgi:ribokinase
MASKLAKECDLTCVMTLGPLGCIAVKPDGNGWKVQAHDLGEDFAETTGAGDTFCGVFAGSIFKHMSLQDSLRRASIAASLACRGIGAQTKMPYADEIEENLHLIPDAVSL